MCFQSNNWKQVKRKSKKSSKYLQSSLWAEKKLNFYIWIFDRYLKNYTKSY